MPGKISATNALEVVRVRLSISVVRESEEYEMLRSCNHEREKKKKTEKNMFISHTPRSCGERVWWMRERCSNLELLLRSGRKRLPMGHWARTASISDCLTIFPTPALAETWSRSNIKPRKNGLTFTGKLRNVSSSPFDENIVWKTICRGHWKQQKR